MKTNRLLLLALTFAALLPFGTRAADGDSVHALLITASNGKGGSDPRLSAYEATLKRNLPFNSFRLAGEGSASVAAGGKSSLELGRGHRLEIQKERGGGIRLRVQWISGGKTLINTTLSLSPGVPAVLGRRGDDGDQVPVVLLIAR